MDKTALVGIDIEGGEKLVSNLEQAGLDIRAALWLYSSEPDKWELVIASPLVDQKGPKKTYIFIQSELANMKSPDDPVGIDLEDISVLSPGHRLIEALLKMKKLYPTGTIKWLNREVINGVYIEDAYIHRLKVTE